MRLDGTIARGGVSADDGFIWFRGGATLIIDPRKGREEIRYSHHQEHAAAPNGRSDRRRRRAANYLSPLRALYFGGRTSEPFALLHADHGDDGHG